MYGRGRPCPLFHPFFAQHFWSSFFPRLVRLPAVCRFPALCFLWRLLMSKLYCIWKETYIASPLLQFSLFQPVWDYNGSWEFCISSLLPFTKSWQTTPILFLCYCIPFTTGNLTIHVTICAQLRYSCSCLQLVLTSF